MGTQELEQRIEEVFSLSVETASPVSVVLLGFKHIKDHYADKPGSWTERTAEWIANELEPGEYVSVDGPGLYWLVLPGYDRRTVGDRLQRMVADLGRQQPRQWALRQKTVHFAWGISVFPIQGAYPREHLGKAKRDLARAYTRSNPLTRDLPYEVSAAA
ncbi:MAG: GGDEF domain-containing protein [Myxococcales bacterium]|nr:GGDEF domain-containing protein [Myxococcales bacterium]